MDRMEIIPEDVQSDDDTDILGEVPIILWFIFGALAVPFLRKKFATYGK